ncbi:hypothetical protein J6590_052529 [Homalodisca vitripennis]|nr:hypothetical protein J6590_052529 [Homalodisca vitripennis]
MPARGDVKYSLLYDCLSVRRTKYTIGVKLCMPLERHVISIYHGYIEAAALGGTPGHAEQTAQKHLHPHNDLSMFAKRRARTFRTHCETNARSRLQCEKKQLKESVSVYRNRIEQLEQYNRNKNVHIDVLVPELPNEQINEIVEALATVAGFDINFTTDVQAVQNSYLEEE